MRRIGWAALLIVAGGATWFLTRGPHVSSGPLAVSLAYIPIADAVALYVAVEEKIFERHGVQPSMTEMRGGPLIIEAVAAGHIDVGFANTPSFLMALAAGIPMRPIGAVQTVDREHVRAALLVRPDSDIREVTDLRGRTIAINAARNIVELALRKVLRNAGVDPGDVRFVEIPFPQMEAALRAGRVDAVPLAEPFWTHAGSRGDLRVVSYFLGDAYPDLEIAGWFTLDSWQRADPERARAVDAVFRDAVEWLHDPANEIRARQIIARYTGTDSTTAMNMAFPTFRARFTVQRLEEMAADMMAHGFLDAPVAVDDSLLAGGR